MSKWGATNDEIEAKLAEMAAAKARRVVPTRPVMVAPVVPTLTPVDPTDEVVTLRRRVAELEEELAYMKSKKAGQMRRYRARKNG